MTLSPVFARFTRSRSAKILLGIALAIAALVVLFDWNWLRGPLERYLMARSGREVRIDDLHVDMALSLEPTIRLRGLYVANAAWAAKQPFAKVGEASFTVVLGSLWQERTIISRLVLIDADVDMERQADGLRNWRLLNPEDRGRGNVTVSTLEAHRTQIRFVNRAIDLDFIATAALLDRAAAAAGGESLSTRIAYKGEYQGHAFSGEALTGRRVSFRASGATFPLRGHLASRGSRVDFDGFFTDVFDLGPMDVNVRVTGPSLALLHPFLRMRPPDSKPYTVEAQLTQTDQVFHFAQLAARIGHTALAGDVIYDRSGERPLVKGSLSSDAADFDDIRPLLGMRPAHEGSDAARDARPGPKDEALVAKRPLRFAALRAVDARIAASAKKLSVMALPTLEDVRVNVDLTEGLLELKSIDLRAAGGRVSGSVTFDARKPSPSALISGDMHGIRIERLLPALAHERGAAAFSGRVRLSGHGDSLAALLAGSTGSLEARLEQGRLSNLADAKLGLNFGKVVSVFLRGDRDIAINCGTLAFDVREGIARARTIVFDTEETHLQGTGTVSLKDERLDLLLTPEPKNPGLFRRRASIRVSGPLRAPAVSIEDRVEQAQSRC